MGKRTLTKNLKSATLRFEVRWLKGYFLHVNSNPAQSRKYILDELAQRGHL